MVKNIELSKMTLKELIEYNKTLDEKDIPEVWERVMTNDGFETNYEISNYGNMRHIATKAPATYQYIRDIYPVKSMYVKGKPNRVGFRINVLVAKHFCIIRDSIANCSNLHVHHIDGNPKNNKFWNLIWVTYQEHYQLHEELDGHKNFFDSNPTLKYTDEQIIAVCEYLEKKTPIKDISIMTGVSTDMIYSIRLGKSRMDLSKGYNFGSIHKHLDDDTIHTICKLMVEGKSNIEISRILGIPPKKVSEIRTGRSYGRISSQYNII